LLFLLINSSSSDISTCSIKTKTSFAFSIFEFILDDKVDDDNKGVEGVEGVEGIEVDDVDDVDNIDDGNSNNLLISLRIGLN
jgi:hypothetical protein